MVQVATQKEQLSARTCNHPRTPPVDGSTDRGSWMGNPLHIPENSRTGVDCVLSRDVPPPTTVQSLTPNTRALSPISAEGRQHIAD